MKKMEKTGRKQILLGGKKAARRRKMTGILLSYLIILTLAGCGNEQTRPDRNSTVSSGSEQKEQATYQEVLEGDSAPDFTAEAKRWKHLCSF